MLIAIFSNSLPNFSCFISCSNDIYKSTFNYCIDNFSDDKVSNNGFYSVIGLKQRKFDGKKDPRG
jgi:hypothetical protein